MVGFHRLVVVVRGELVLEAPLPRRRSTAQDRGIFLAHSARAGYNITTLNAVLGT
jgi:hypothetical protein